MNNIIGTVWVDINFKTIQACKETLLYGSLWDNILKATTDKIHIGLMRVIRKVLTDEIS